MKYLILFFSFLCSLFIGACSSEEIVDDSDGPEKPKDEVLSDTIEFMVLAYVDKASVEGHLGGSERVVRQKMERLFQDVSVYWNKAGKGRLNAYYKYVLGEMKIYDCGSNDPEFNDMVYYGPMDFSKYGVAVIFDGLQDRDDDRGPGGAAGGGADNRCVITVIAQKDQPKDLFNEQTRNTLTHELGHYREVTDVYQYIIAAKDNPVNGVAYNAPDCIMNWAAAGVWSDYAINCINAVGDAKRVAIEYPNIFDSWYPKRLEINVKEGDKPVRADIKLYPSRAGSANHNRDIYHEPMVTGKSGTDGKWVLNDMLGYFRVDKSKHPEINVPSDLPYGRCFGFLAEIIYNNQKKYVWMSEIDVQMVTFEGKDTYSVDVIF